MVTRTALATAASLVLSAAYGVPETTPVAVATVAPAALARGEAAVLRLQVLDRVPGDRVHHCMIWTPQPVPSPLRVEGANHILADGNPDGVFPLAPALWPDGTYTIMARAYYYASPDAALQRLDTRVTLRVQGGPPPPRLRVTPGAATVLSGEILTLTLTVDNPGCLGEFADAVLLSRGQDLGPRQRLPLEQAETVLASWPALGELHLDTTGWRAQSLTCLAVRARFRPRPGGQPVNLATPVPAVTVREADHEPDPRVLPSWRGDRPIHLLTTDAAMNAFPYPTCSAWRKGGRQVFFESDRARPDGTRVAGERQLLMADVETGNVTHLATLAAEATDAYGAFHVGASSQYHSDYAPEADLLVYYDMTGHHLYTLRPGSTPVEVLHETQGRIGDPPAIARDGTRLLYYTILPGPNPSRYFTGLSSAIFTLDLDPRTGAALGPPHLVYAYPWRKSPPQEAAVGFNNLIGCDHVQFCPTDPRRLLYAHEGGYPRNGAPENTRIWCMNDDGSQNRPLAPAQEQGSYYTHEVYGPSGRFVYAVWGGSVARIEVETGRFECVYRAQKPLLACHLAVSPDERWLAADMLSGFGQDGDGNSLGALFLIETASGAATFLAAFPAGSGHPRHTHPNFSPDGTKIGFTLAQGRTHSQLAWVDVTYLRQASGQGN